MKAPATLAVLACILTAASSLCAAQTSYAITDLGTLSSNGYSVARAVNATAEVTGAAGDNNSNISDIFFYSNCEEGKRRFGMGRKGRSTLTC